MDAAAKASQSVKKVLLLLLLAGCAAPPRPGFRPLLPAPNVKLARAAEATNSTPSQFSAAIPWEYAPGASNYCWTLQTSTDLVLWVDLPSGCLTGELYAGATNAARFFRLKGSAQ